MFKIAADSYSKAKGDYNSALQKAPCMTQHKHKKMGAEDPQDPAHSCVNCRWPTDNWSYKTKNDVFKITCKEIGGLNAEWRLWQTHDDVAADSSAKHGGNIGWSKDFSDLCEVRRATGYGIPHSAVTMVKIRAMDYTLI